MSDTENDISTLGDEVLAESDRLLEEMADEGGLDVFDETSNAKLENQGVPIHIKGLDGKLRYFRQNGERVPVTITVCGVNSDRHKGVEKEIRLRKLNPGSINSQKFYDDAIEKAAACTMSWVGMFNKGKEVRCDRHNAAAIYKALPHILDQVQEAMNDHSLFSGSSSPVQ
jgi:hypothetical protein